MGPTRNVGARETPAPARTASRMARLLFTCRRPVTGTEIGPAPGARNSHTHCDRWYRYVITLWTAVEGRPETKTGPEPGPVFLFGSEFVKRRFR